MKPLAVFSVVVAVTALVAGFVTLMVSERDHRRTQAVDAVRVACGEDTADRFEAFIESLDTSGHNALHEARVWAARCAVGP